MVPSFHQRRIFTVLVCVVAYALLFAYTNADVIGHSAHDMPQSAETSALNHDPEAAFDAEHYHGPQVKNAMSPDDAAFSDVQDI